MVDALGKRVKDEGLSIIGVPTSERTKQQANSLGIITKGIDEVDHIDLTIDGADQIDKNFQGIKGGGGAHLWEKKLLPSILIKICGSLMKVKWLITWVRFRCHLK